MRGGGQEGDNTVISLLWSQAILKLKHENKQNLILAIEKNITDRCF